MECVRLRVADHRRANPDVIRRNNQQHYANNKERRKEIQREWNKANALHAQEYAKQYRKARASEIKAYRQANRDKALNQANLRRARQLQSLPKWADRKALFDVYKNRPPGMHVDHIIPLVNDKVCGLHVANNLQYLTPEANMAKSNKFDIDEFNK